MKKDKYLRARGGKSLLIDIGCAACGSLIINYQKDGVGYLHRCYINRIMAPEKYSKLQYDPAINEPKDLPDLVCDCGEVIGYSMKYTDGRLAYRLERGKYKTGRNKNYQSVQK